MEKNKAAAMWTEKKKIKKSIWRSKSIKSSKIIRLMEKKSQMNVVLVEDEDVIHK